MKYLLALDIDSSSIKASLLNAITGQRVAVATSPRQEIKMVKTQPGWAEQHPERWWQEVVNATAELRAAHDFYPAQVAGIDITYQMHGLVLLDKAGQVLRPAIIWCDSRAVDFDLTASKLKWVRENEPEIYVRIHKIQLPGDYIAFKLTGELETTVSGHSEGVFWNVKEQALARELLEYYGISVDLLPEVVDAFAVQGRVNAAAAQEMGLVTGTPVNCRVGDHFNIPFGADLCM